MHKRLLISLTAILLATSAPAVQSAAGRVPQGFVGAMIDGPLLGRQVNLDRETGVMAANGVENARVAFSWQAAQPYPDWRSVPTSEYRRFENVATDVPTDFSAMDRVVAAAANHRITLMPVVIDTPYWDADAIGRRREPLRVSPYADFLTVLIERYGPGGTYWYEHPFVPSVPIRAWQVWNEPSGYYYWDRHPFAPSYVALLRAAHEAIKQADPGASVVLAGFPNRAWQSIQQVYGVRGARRLFDAVAVHPYTAQPSGVITILRRVREVMNRFGDRGKPMIASELGWPSSQGLGHPALGFATTPQGQAQRVAELLPMLGAERQSLGLAGFDLYTWMGPEHRGNYAFDFSGLESFDAATRRVRAKPALAAFRRGALALERCAVKSSVANRCARS